MAAAADIAGAYGFDEVAIGERLEGGYANDLYRVTADGRDLVLRLKHPPVSRQDIAWEHDVVARLSRALPEVHAPLEALDGTTAVAIGGTCAWLMPFVDGEPADDAREAHRIAAAGALGRLHRAAAALAVPSRPRLKPLAQLDWPPLTVPEPLRPWMDTIAEAREWAIAYVARVRRLPTSLIHGDYFPGNVLLADGEVVAIIDWEEAQTDWMAWDLAAAAGSFCSSGDELDTDAFGRFVDAYRADGGTSPAADDDLLLPLLRVKRVLEVLRAPTDRHPRWDLQERNLRSLATLPT